MAFCLLKLFCLDIFDRLVGFYLNNDIPLALMASESIAHEARGIIVKRGRGGEPLYYKSDGDTCQLLSTLGVNCRLWSHFECLGWKVTIFAHSGITQVLA